MFMCKSKCFHAKSLDRCFIMNFGIAASVKFRFSEVHLWGSYLTLACTRFLWIIFWMPCFKFGMSSISKTLHMFWRGVLFCHFLSALGFQKVPWKQFFRHDFQVISLSYLLYMMYMDHHWSVRPSYGSLKTERIVFIGCYWLVIVWAGKWLRRRFF